MPSHLSTAVLPSDDLTVSPISAVRAYLEDLFANFPPSRSNQKPKLKVPAGQQFFVGPTTGHASFVPQNASTSKQKRRRPNAIPIIDPDTGKDVSSELYEQGVEDQGSDVQLETEVTVYTALLTAVPQHVPIPPSSIAAMQRASERFAKVQKPVLAFERKNLFRTKAPNRL